MGLKIVAVPYLSVDVYQMIMRDPIGPSGDLKGRKLRATPQYRPMLRLLGAGEVVMPNAETYAALEKGVVDGAAWTSIGILRAKFYEVNKYLLRPTFGAAHLLILMNLNRWKGLSAEERKVMEEAGRAVEKSWATDDPRMMREEEATADQGSRHEDHAGCARPYSRKCESDAAEGTWTLAAGRDARGVDELEEVRKGERPSQIGCCPRVRLSQASLPWHAYLKLHDAITRGGYQLAALMVILIAGAYASRWPRATFSIRRRIGRTPSSLTCSARSSSWPCRNRRAGAPTSRSRY